MSDSITAKVFRYDPSVDGAPYYSTYEVPWDDDGSGTMTGLQVLNYIYENEEPIVVDYNCRGGLCGRCGMVIDGKPCLACHTSLDAGEHTFEPLGDLPVIRDLMVDRAPFMQKFVASEVAKKTVEPIAGAGNLDFDLYWNTFERLNSCRECMCCYEACPALTERNDWDFVGPGAMMQIAYRALDPYDEGDRVKQAVFSGLWRCDLCGKCMLVCPAQIDHVGLLTQLQTMAEQQGLKPTDPSAFPSAPVEKQEPAAEADASAPAFNGVNPEEIMANLCGDCHEASELMAYKVDAATAESRAKSHASSAAALSEEQQAALIAQFTE